MRTKHTILTRDEYESRILDGLAKIDLVGDQATNLVQARWATMGADCVLIEAQGRGLVLDRGDLFAFMRDVFGADVFPDGEPIRIDFIWPANLVDSLVKWALEHDRGAAPVEDHEPLTIDTIIEGLQSDRLETRIISTAKLGAWIGMFSAANGITHADFERVRPTVGRLIEEAASGDAHAFALVKAFVAGIIDEAAQRKAARPIVTVAGMLSDLRSRDRAVREKAAGYLRVSLSAGLAIRGESAEDVDLLVGPQLDALIDQAVLGDRGAVDRLQASITTDPEAASSEKTPAEATNNS